MKQSLVILLFISLLSMGCPQLHAQGLGGIESSQQGGSEGRDFFNPKELEPRPSKPTFFKPSQQAGLLYQIHVTGEVLTPATLRVPPSTRLSEVLDFVGGISSNGSRRFIEIRRKDKKTQIVDFFRFQYQGLLESNPFVYDNDVVFVPTKKSVVSIGGPVKVPGEYELREDYSLNELIELAGGFSAGRSEQLPLKIVRYIDGKQSLIDIHLDSERAKGFSLENGDLVVVPHVLLSENKFDFNAPTLPGESKLFLPSFDSQVFINGGVGKPGAYPFNPHSNLNRYLALAGGTTKLALEDDIYILNSVGVRMDKLDRINPGDTIVVPQRYMPPESWVTLGLSIVTSLGLIATTVITLSN